MRCWLLFKMGCCHSVLKVLVLHDVGVRAAADDEKLERTATNFIFS